MKSLISLAAKIRIIPAVIIATSLLLVIKSSNIIIEFSQSTLIPVTARAQDKKQNINEQNEIETQNLILLSLDKRREKLEADEQQIIIQKKLNLITEKRINEKIQQLEILSQKIDKFEKQKKQDKINRTKKFAKIYEKMKPKDAAKIFDVLNIEIIKEVAKYIKAESISKILAKMKVEIAQRLTTDIVKASITKNLNNPQQLPRIGN